MSKRIQVLKITRSDAGKPGTKGYKVIEVAYKDPDGKTKGMKVLDFVQREVFSQFKDVNDGDFLDAEFEKNDKDYWQFRSVAKAAAGSTDSGTKVQSGTSGATTRGNWETSEERAARQVMIVRQPSLSTAVAHKPKASTDEIIATAKQFEAFVLGTETAVGGSDVE